MEIRQLRYFLGIAQAGSLSAAALRLRVAQPALSQQLARLEAELGAPLMQRGPRGVVLTPAGQALREHAEVVLRDLARAEAAVRAEAGGPLRGHVAIGLPTTVAMVLTLPLLRAMRARHPEVSLHLAESQSGHLLDWLRQGQVDVAVLFDLTGGPLQGLRAEALLEEEMVLASAPGGARGAITLAEATCLPMLLPAREHGFRRLLDAHAAALGLRWQLVAEVDALPHVKRGVAAGLAHTVLPWVALQEELASGALQARRIVSPVLSRKVLLAQAADRPASRAAEAARGEIAALVRDLVQQGLWRARLL